MYTALVDILQQTGYQADIRMRLHGLRWFVHDKSAANCQQSRCKTRYPQGCFKLLQVVTKNKFANNMLQKPHSNRLVATC